MAALMAELLRGALQLSAAVSSPSIVKVSKFGVKLSGRESLRAFVTFTLIHWYLENLLSASRNRYGTGNSRIHFPSSVIPPVQETSMPLRAGTG
jgi:hypothetical protein